MPILLGLWPVFSRPQRDRAISPRSTCSYRGAVRRPRRPQDPRNCAELGPRRTSVQPSRLGPQEGHLTVVDHRLNFNL